MDTGTHFAFGLGLAGLSQIDPGVAGDVWTSAAVLLGTVVGSQAPDADMLLRFRGNETYIRHHRGLSHAVPAWFVWAALISSAIWAVFPEIPYRTLFFWVFVSVAVHVVSDLFNTYGTQAFRPVSSRWIAWNVMPIFDPFLFAAHAAAVGLWAAGFAEASVIFPALYIVLLGYYAWRTVFHARLERRLREDDNEYRRGDKYTAIPTIKWNIWNVVKRGTDDRYAIGCWKEGRLSWSDRMVCERSPEIEASKRHPAVAAFLSFSPHPCASVERRGDSTVVRWVDARYQHRKQFPFLAVVKYNAHMEPVYSYVGWISDEKLEQRLSEPAEAAHWNA